MALVRFDSGSAANGGKIARGCEYCVKGAKMVLFVTGRCRAGCFYCPVSARRKGKDAVYANEGLASNDDQVIEEAEAMAAEGTGITGGDPSEDMERTIHFIRLLKDHFGKGHHIHMYTSVISLENARRLEEAGLDEIRYHPREDLWDRMETTELASVIDTVRMDVGIEVPALPGTDERLAELVEYSISHGAKFVNLNELEFSESNWDMMGKHGYEVKDGLSEAVRGSEETALNVMGRFPDYPIHFCSSTFKDGVQLRNRLKRRAENTAREYDVVTEDGTFVKGIVYTDDLDAAAAYLRENYGVPDELMCADRDRGRLEVASWVLEEIGHELPFRCYIVEEYPTEDRLEVERTPIERDARAASHEAADSSRKPRKSVPKVRKTGPEKGRFAPGRTDDALGSASDCRRYVNTFGEKRRNLGRPTTSGRYRNMRKGPSPEGGGKEFVRFHTPLFLKRGDRLSPR